MALVGPWSCCAVCWGQLCLYPRALWTWRQQNATYGWLVFVVVVVVVCLYDVELFHRSVYVSMLEHASLALFLHYGLSQFNVPIDTIHFDLSKIKTLSGHFQSIRQQGRHLACPFTHYPFPKRSDPSFSFLPMSNLSDGLCHCTLGTLDLHLKYACAIHKGSPFSILFFFSNPLIQNRTQPLCLHRSLFSVQKKKEEERRKVK